MTLFLSYKVASPNNRQNNRLAVDGQGQCDRGDGSALRRQRSAGAALPCGLHDLTKKPSDIDVDGLNSFKGLKQLLYSISQAMTGYQFSSAA